MNLFSNISVYGWRQFDRVEIDLHPRLTILTGANGSGKTTVLELLAKHFGWSRPFLGTPKLNRDGTIRYTLDRRTPRPQWEFEKHVSVSKRDVGVVRYSNGGRATFVAPDRGSIQYELEINGQQEVFGCHIGSHRAVPNYTSITGVSLQGITPAQAYQNYFGELLNSYTGRKSRVSPLYHLKEALIAMALLGPGNIHVKGNKKIEEAYIGFIEKLRQLLPSSIGFRGIDIRMPDVVLLTRSGEHILEASSGGVHSLIDTAWRIFMYSLTHNEFVVTIDEPENHLHPSMQRSLLSDLVSAFPTAQFIVATHSPLIVSSVKDSNVFVLSHGLSPSETYNLDQQLDVAVGEIDASLPPERSVRSILLDNMNKAGDASSVLRDALGLTTTIPDWVDSQLDEIVGKYTNTEFSKNMLQRLRAELERNGMSEYYPSALDRVTASHDKAN